MMSLQDETMRERIDPRVPIAAAPGLGVRKAPAAAGSGNQQIREGVELAVRLAELIQGPTKPSR